MKTYTLHKGKMVQEWDGNWVKRDEVVEYIGRVVENNQTKLDEVKRALKKAEAEVARLRTFTTRTIIPNKKLQNKIERLTKAGYAMAVKIEVYGIAGNFTDNRKLVDDWSAAAKDGKKAQ